jgi:hypothetical protein
MPAIDQLANNTGDRLDKRSVICLVNFCLPQGILHRWPADKARMARELHCTADWLTVLYTTYAALSQLDQLKNAAVAADEQQIV